MAIPKKTIPKSTPAAKPEPAAKKSTPAKRTVRRRKAAPKAEPEPTQTRLEFLQEKAAQYKKIAEAAHEAGSFTPAVKARDQERAVQVLIDELHEQERVEANLPATMEEARLEHLKTVRKMRASADTRGSYVAAEKLLETEQQLMEVIYADKVDEGSAEEMLASLVEIVSSLPDILRLQFDREMKNRRSSDE